MRTLLRFEFVLIAQKRDCGSRVAWKATQDGNYVIRQSKLIWSKKFSGWTTLITFMEIMATTLRFFSGQNISNLRQIYGPISVDREAFRIELSIYGFLNGCARNSCNKSVINLWEIVEWSCSVSISRWNVISIVSIPDSLAKAKLEDCEKPPEVENASVVVAYDENEEFVTATYRCHDGFKLRGKKDITCDLDTDEWQETPPLCEAGKPEKF